MILPIPQLERIIPFTVSQWNTIKGGSDTITKLLWLNMYDPPCKSPSSHAIARMFLLGNVLVHRLHHFFTSKSDLAKAYPSLKHFRNAASHRSTFHETLLQIVHGIKQRTISRTIRDMSPSLSAPTTEGILTRRKDTRTMAVAWGTLSAGVTPQRRVKKFYNKNPTNISEEIVHSRMKACTGVPVYRVDLKTKGNRGIGSRGRCAECNMQTNTFCIVCKRWLCDPQLAANRANHDYNDDPKFIKINFQDGALGDDAEANTICAIFSCWHKAHRAALEADGALERGWHCDDSNGGSSMDSP